MCLFTKEEKIKEDNSIEIVVILDKTQGKKELQDISLSVHGCIQSAY